MVPPPPLASLEEAGLVARLRRGDEAAFEELVRRHATHLYGVASRLLGCPEEARDAVQDALLGAFRAIGSYDEASCLRNWLHRIVLNAALMRLRRRRRHPEAPIDELLPRFDADGHHLAHPCEWEGSIEERIALSEVRELVRRSIARLPDAYRTVLLLRDIEEHDTLETAALLGIQPNLVKVRLHRARQALRTLLAHTLQSPSATRSPRALRAGALHANA